MSINTDTVLLLLGITLMYSTPMVFAAQGSVISEVSGVVNIGIEGMMTIGAFTGAAVGYFSGNPWLGFICAGAAGAVFGLIHAFASVTCKADQTVCGIAMNLIGPGLALFLSRVFFDGATQTLPVTNKIPKLFGSSGLPGNRFRTAVPARRKQFPRILRPDDLSEYLSGCGRVSAVSVSVRNLRQDISLEALPHVGPRIPVPQVHHNFMIEGLAPINDVVGPGIIPRLQMSAE